MSNALSTRSNTRMVWPRNPARPGLLGRPAFNDIFDSFFSDWPQLEQRTVKGYPVSDIYRGEDGSTVIEFALAGFQKKDLTIEVKPEKRSITVAAGSATDGKDDRRIARRSFSKTYVNYDDNLDLSKATAVFENGLLVVTVPTRPEVEPVVITID